MQKIAWIRFYLGNLDNKLTEDDKYYYLNVYVFNDESLIRALNFCLLKLESFKQQSWDGRLKISILGHASPINSAYNTKEGGDIFSFLKEKGSVNEISFEHKYFIDFIIIILNKAALIVNDKLERKISVQICIFTCHGSAAYVPFNKMLMLSYELLTLKQFSKMNIWINSTTGAQYFANDHIPCRSSSEANFGRYLLSPFLNCYNDNGIWRWGISTSLDNFDSIWCQGAMPEGFKAIDSRIVLALVNMYLEYTKQVSKIKKTKACCLVHIPDDPGKSLLDRTVLDFINDMQQLVCHIIPTVVSSYIGSNSYEQDLTELFDDINKGHRLIDNSDVWLSSYNQNQYNSLKKEVKESLLNFSNKIKEAILISMDIINQVNLGSFNSLDMGVKHILTQINLVSATRAIGNYAISENGNLVRALVRNSNLGLLIRNDLFLDMDLKVLNDISSSLTDINFEKINGNSFNYLFNFSDGFLKRILSLVCFWIPISKFNYHQKNIKSYNMFSGYGDVSDDMTSLNWEIILGNLCTIREKSSYESQKIGFTGCMSKLPEKHQLREDEIFTEFRKLMPILRKIVKHFIDLIEDQKSNNKTCQVTSYQKGILSNVYNKISSLSEELSNYYNNDFNNIHNARKVAWNLRQVMKMFRDYLKDSQSTHMVSSELCVNLGSVKDRVEECLASEGMMIDDLSFFYSLGMRYNATAI